MDPILAQARMNEYLDFWFTKHASKERNYEGIEQSDFDDMLKYILTGDPELLEMPFYGGN